MHTLMTIMPYSLQKTFFSVNFVSATVFNFSEIYSLVPSNVALHGGKHFKGFTGPLKLPGGPCSAFMQMVLVVDKLFSSSHASGRVCVCLCEGKDSDWCIIPSHGSHGGVCEWGKMQTG